MKRKRTNIKWELMTKAEIGDIELKCSRCGQEKEELWMLVSNAEIWGRLEAMGIDSEGYWMCDECIGYSGKIKRKTHGIGTQQVTPGWLEDLEAFEKTIRSMKRKHDPREGDKNPKQKD